MSDGTNGGKIVVGIGGDVEELKSAIEQAQKMLDDLGEGASTLGKKSEEASEGASSLDTVLTGFLERAGQIGFEKLIEGLHGLKEGLMGMIEGAMAAGGHLTDLSARTGIATKDLQELGYAGRMVGLSTESIAMSAMKMQRSIMSGSAGSVAALKQLGLSFNDLAGKSTGDQLSLVVTKISQMKDPAERTATAYTLLGRSGAALIPLGEGLDEARKRAEELGIVLDETALKANDDMGDAVDSLEMAFDGLKNNIGSVVTMSPALLQLFKEFGTLVGMASKYVHDHRAALTQLVNQGVIMAVSAFKYLLDAVDFIEDAFNGLAPIIGYLLDVWIGWEKFIWGFINGAIKTLTLGFVDFGQAAENLGVLMDALKLLWDGLKFTVTELAVAVLEAYHAFLLMKEGDSERAVSVQQNIDLLKQYALETSDHANALVDGTAKTEENAHATDGLRSSLDALIARLKDAKAAHADVPPEGGKGGWKQSTDDLQNYVSKITDLNTQLKVMQQNATGDVLGAQFTQIDAELTKQLDDLVKLQEQHKLTSDQARNLAAAQEQIADAKKQAALISYNGTLAEQHKMLADATQGTADLASQNADLQAKLSGDSLWSAQAAAANQYEASLRALNEQQAANARQILEKPGNAAALQATNAELEHQKKVLEENYALQQKMVAQNFIKGMVGDGADVASKTIENVGKAVKMLGDNISSSQIETGLAKAFDAISKGGVDSGHVIDELMSKVGSLNATDLSALISKVQSLDAGTGKYKDTIDKLKAAWDQLPMAEKKAVDEAMKFAAIDKVFGKVNGILDGVCGVFEELGIKADSGVGKALAAVKQLSAAAQEGAKSFAAFQSGDIVGGITHGLSAVKNAIGAIKTLFGTPSWKKVGEEAGRVLGVAISDELAKTIEKTTKDLKVDVGTASLLNLDKVMDETGKSVRDMSKQVMDLFGLQFPKGSKAAEQQMDQIDKAWNDVRKDAAETGDAMTVAMLKAAQASGHMTDSMKEFVKAQHEAMSAGAGKIADGLTSALGSVSKDDLGKYEEFGKSSAFFFVKGWEATVAEKGLMGALDLLGDKAAQMYDQLIAVGNTAAASLLAPIVDLQNKIGNNDAIKGLMDTLQGAGEVFKGMANTGYYDPEMAKQFGEMISTAHQSLLDAEVDSKEAMQAIMPQLASAVQAAQEMGVPLDENTAKLKEQAEAMGFAFPEAPLVRIADLLESIAKKLGADIPAALNTAGQSMDQFGQKGEQAFDKLDGHPIPGGGGGSAPGSSGPSGGDSTQSGGSTPSINQADLKKLVDNAQQFKATMSAVPPIIASMSLKLGDAADSLVTVSAVATDTSTTVESGLVGAAQSASSAWTSSAGNINDSVIDNMTSVMQSFADTGQAAIEQADYVGVEWNGTVSKIGMFALDAVEPTTTAFQALADGSLGPLMAVQDAVDGIYGALSGIPGAAANAGGALSGLGDGGDGGGGPKPGSVPGHAQGADFSAASDGVFKYHRGERISVMPTGRSPMSREIAQDVADMVRGGGGGGCESGEINIGPIYIGGENFGNLLARKTKSGEWQIHSSAVTEHL